MDLKLDIKKVDKLAEDLAKLEAPKVVKGGADGEGAVPMFQSKGYLEKFSKKKWYKRFFVLRDSFLLSYNLSKSDFTVEPNKCIHLAKCKFEVLTDVDKPNAFAITTADKDRFVLAAASEKELNAWRKDIEIARIITHKNMVKLAVENQCLAEAKELQELMQSHSTSALTIFSNPEYIKRTPVAGGAEGWLRSCGFCTPVKKKSLKKCYFMLKDSHILMFQGGDVLKKPRGCMYLVGTETKEMEDEDPTAFKFICSSNHCADFIELVANSEQQRQRWISALRVGARVTYGDFKLLLKEHEILTNYTPDAGAPPEAPEDNPDEPLPEHNLENLNDETIQGEELEPGTVQPYDENGNPFVRNPEGKLVDAEGNEANMKTARFGPRGERLDAFNRALPENARPMFTEDGVAIGVGPDGNHYLPDGTLIPQDAPHFDEEGNQLDQATVEAANAIAEKVNVALQVRARMRAEGAGTEEVDVLGRTFRPSKDTEGSDMVKNADGEMVPIKTARRTVDQTGKLTEEEIKREPLTGTLAIMFDDEGDVVPLGSVEIDENSTLSDVRSLIGQELSSDLPEFRFLMNYVPLNPEEEITTLALSALPEITVRGIELKPNPRRERIFSKKVGNLISYEEEKLKEKSEFDNIMARVRAGNFLKRTDPLA